MLCYLLSHTYFGAILLSFIGFGFIIVSYKVTTDEEPTFSKWWYIFWIISFPIFLILYSIAKRYKIKGRREDVFFSNGLFYFGISLVSIVLIYQWVGIESLEECFNLDLSFIILPLVFLALKTYLNGNDYTIDSYIPKKYKNGRK